MLVLDCSVALSWCFEDEKTAYAESVLDSLAGGGSAVVPPLWAYEVLNVLAGAERRKRITQAQSSAFWQMLQSLPIEVIAESPSHFANDILSLSRKFRLTAYDSAYLELCLRKNIRLATLDHDLKLAAQTAGVFLAHPQSK